MQGLQTDVHRNYLKGVPHGEKLKALLLYSSGLSMTRMAKLFGVSTVAVLKWIRVFGKDLCSKPNTPQKSSVIVMKGDEFWLFIQRKSSGFSRPRNRHEGKPIDWELGRVLTKLSNVSMGV